MVSRSCLPSILLAVAMLTTTPLHAVQIHRAAETGDIEEVEQLIAQGADVNEALSNGVTALMLASSNGHAEIVSLLLSNGADMNARDKLNGLTALMRASINGHAEIVGLLLTADANVNVRDHRGRTALFYASENGHVGVANWLAAPAVVNVGRITCNVRVAQEMLRALGHDPGPVDGRSGPSTTRALREFQRESQLDAHGRVDAATCNALTEAANAKPLDNTPPAEDDPRLVVVREWSGAVRTYIQCEPGESVFYGGTFVPCGWTFKNYPNQIGGGAKFAGARRGPEDPCKSLADRAAYSSGAPKTRYTSALERARRDSFRAEQVCREALEGN